MKRPQQFTMLQPSPPLSGGHRRARMMTSVLGTSSTYHYLHLHSYLHHHLHLQPQLQQQQLHNHHLHHNHHHPPSKCLLQLHQLLVLLLSLTYLFASVDASRRHWSASYNGEPPPQHALRHHRDHTREFSCGRLYYRTFYLDPRQDALYVGAMDNVFKLNLKDINRTDCEIDSIKLEPSSMPSCVAKGKSENFDCRNHIRVIQPMGADRSQLYVCGTNAYQPKDWIVNTSNLSISTQTIPGIGNGIAKCPFDPDDNSTALWVDKGNPGDLPGLYSGSVAEYSKADTVIFRTDLFNLQTGEKVYPFKRTIKYDSKWLDKPNFVGSFEVGDYVYFFFRESAVEYINCGKAIYSRIARVCKRDTGGRNILNKNWATFIKARLVCKIGGVNDEFPFYFNEIQSIYKRPNDGEKFYGVFSTSMNGIIGSAICTFSLSKVEEVFLGKFKEQATSSSAWLPVLSSKVPEPRPGTCVNDTQVLPDSVLNFIRGHPLMDSSVANDNSLPVFYKRDIIFTKIVADVLDVDGLQYTVYLGGTSTGYVYKVVEWYDASGAVHSNLVDVFEATTPEPIRAMEISPLHRSIYVASDSKIRQIGLVSTCRGRYESCTRCIQDPYCGWDREAGECKPYNNGLLQDITNATTGVCDAPGVIETKHLKVAFGESVHLPCSLNSHDMEATLAAQGPIKWYYFRSAKSSSFEVVPKRDKYVQTADHGLVILGVTDRESGRYDCRLGPGTVFSYIVEMDAKTCSTPSETEFRKVYSDWCHQFEKYKSDMKRWQLRQSKCQSKQNQVRNTTTTKTTIRKMDQRKGFQAQMPNRDAFTIPKLAYEFYFKAFGLISTGLDFGQRYGPIKQDKTATNLKRFYCQLVCLMLWFFAIRGFVLMFIGDREIQLMLGDLTGFWNDYRMYYLMPTFYYSLQTAIIATIFLRNEQELAWLVPFVSVKQMQTNSIRTAKYDTNNHERRTQVTIIINNLIVLVATGMVGMLYTLTAYENMDQYTFRLFVPWIGVQCIWIFFMAGINMFTMTYFNLVCLILSNRFKQVCKDIEALAESDPGPLGSKNNALSTLYYEHNEICELVDESNSFWQSFIFFNYMCHIPCNCYALYNLFFADFDDLLAIVTWTVFLHTILFLAFISLSAADVSAEAHSPYTALHTLSLLQLPIDLEVNMSTFLHRVRGPTIGFSCLDLFVITNASISNTIAAVASYFLIVADFSRSTAAANAAEKREEAARAASAMNITTTAATPVAGS